ncbi:heavy-metal-associated domain-containing protein [Kribbia dieselivorans]|uniref:heavy-metal-associated domain-containing protein n=1 Tax=Kribbia dieselivorans TaxID=331526 RepID=UPI000837E3A4|nr:heavy-metal-associated domain-containing protein [Kribbia dieselivorans]
MSTTAITVTGMTCGHCTASVTEELKTIPGVTDVAIDLVKGGDSPVTITSDAELSQDAITDAVTEAGYTVTFA